MNYPCAICGRWLPTEDYCGACDCCMHCCSCDYDEHRQAALDCAYFADRFLGEDYPD